MRIINEIIFFFQKSLFFIKYVYMTKYQLYWNNIECFSVFGGEPP